MWVPLQDSAWDSERPATGSDGAEAWRPDPVPPPVGVIACTCPVLVPVLARLALPRERVWRTPGGTVALPEVEAGAPALGSVIAWLGLREVLVLGHSRCEWARARHPEPPADESAPFMVQVVRNVCSARRLRARAMDHTLSQAKALLAHPALAAAAARGELTVRAWLHLDETGRFLEHDLSIDRPALSGTW